MVRRWKIADFVAPLPAGAFGLGGRELDVRSGFGGGAFAALRVDGRDIDFVDATRVGRRPGEFCGGQGRGVHFDGGARLAGQVVKVIAVPVFQKTIEKHAHGR